MLVRDEFSFLFTSRAQYMAVCAARGLGKTVAAIQWLVDRLIRGQPNGSGIFFSATLRQAKATVEPPMRSITFEFPESFYSYNKTESKFTFKFGDGDVRELFLASYENPSTKRGYHPHTIVLDECASMPYDMFGTIVLPMLAKDVDKEDVKLLAIGTAQGKNMFYEMINKGRSKEYIEWESYILRASSSKILDKAYLENMQKNMTVAEYAQEFECDFNANVLVGSVFGDILRNVTVDNIREDVQWEPMHGVYTSWDIGLDGTAIWFFQVDPKSGEVRFIDYLEGSMNDIAYYCNQVLSKPYTYRRCFLPHDSIQKHVNAPVSTSEMIGASGLPVDVVGRTDMVSGINCSRLLLQTAKFNKVNCGVGLEHLGNYRYKVDYSRGVNYQEPRHDEHSHAADAFRYAAVSKDSWKNKTEYNKMMVADEYDILGQV